MLSMETVHLAVYDTLADWEPGHAVAHIARPAYQREPGRYQVRTVAETSAPVTTMGGVRIQPDLRLDELDPRDSALLILPGAQAWDAGGLGAFADAARRFVDAGTPVAAICGATFGLAGAGLLDDRAHTSSAPEYLAASGYAGGERYVDADAVHDRGIITAGPLDPVPFAREIFTVLDLYEPAVLAAWFDLFAHGDATAFAALADA